MARLMTRQYVEALEDLDDLQSIMPSAAALQLHAALQMSRWQSGLALTDLDEAVRLAPQDPAVLATGRESGCSSAGSTTPAPTPTRRSSSTRRTPPPGPTEEWWRSISSATADAIADTDEAIKLDPSRAGNYYENRAQAHADQHDTAAALADLDLAAQTRPDDPKLAAARARVLAGTSDAKLRDGKTALTLATRAVEQTKRADATAPDRAGRGARRARRLPPRHRGRRGRAEAPDRRPGRSPSIRSVKSWPSGRGWALISRMRVPASPTVRKSSRRRWAISRIALRVTASMSAWAMAGAPTGSSDSNRRSLACR